MELMDILAKLVNEGLEDKPKKHVEKTKTKKKKTEKGRAKKKG